MVGVGAFISLHCFDSVDRSTEWHLACQATCSKCLLGTLTKCKRRPIKRKVKVIVFVARQRESGDSPYAVKLSVEELDGFYKQISTLPCSISEQSTVSVSTPCVVYILSDYGTSFCVTSTMYLTSIGELA